MHDREGHVWRGGGCVQERQPLKRALRILLESIFVTIYFFSRDAPVFFLMPTQIDF